MCHFHGNKPNLICLPSPHLGGSGVGKTATVNQMLGKLGSPGAFYIKYGSILGNVLLHSEIKKSRLVCMY